MSEKVNKTIEGYCPYIDDTHEIQAEYIIQRTIGASGYSSHYSTVHCNYVDECTLTNECPLRAVAKKTKV